MALESARIAARRPAALSRRGQRCRRAAQAHVIMVVPVGAAYVGLDVAAPTQACTVPVRTDATSRSRGFTLVSGGTTPGHVTPYVGLNSQRSLHKANLRDAVQPPHRG
jgi:hypothetical protein